MEDWAGLGLCGQHPFMVLCTMKGALSCIFLVVLGWPDAEGLVVGRVVVPSGS